MSQTDLQRRIQRSLARRGLGWVRNAKPGEEGSGFGGMPAGAEEEVVVVGGIPRRRGRRRRSPAGAAGAERGAGSLDDLRRLPAAGKVPDASEHLVGLKGPLRSPHVDEGGIVGVHASASLPVVVTPGRAALESCGRSARPVASGTDSARAEESSAGTPV
jgi:hypothetical protein